MDSLHVSISAETLFKIGPLAVTNSILSGSIVTFLLVALCVYFGSMKKQLAPRGFQNLLESILELLYNMTKDVAGDTKARLFFPMIATSFLYILLNNWSGLIPGNGTITIMKNENSEGHSSSLVPQAVAANETHGEVMEVINDEHSSETMMEEEAIDEEVGASEEERHIGKIPLFRAATADLNTTLALALISVFLTQYWGVRYLGLGYFKKFFNFTAGPIFTFVGILELVSEFAKIISFAFRLFGNVFAGEVLLVVIAALSPKFFPIIPLPFYGLEVFVGFIQALVFAMLSLVFINMATISHDEH